MTSVVFMRLARGNRVANWWPHPGPLPLTSMVFARLARGKIGLPISGLTPALSNGEGAVSDVSDSIF